MRVANAIIALNVLLRFPSTAAGGEARHQHLLLCGRGSCTASPQEVGCAPQGAGWVLLCPVMPTSFQLPVCLAHAHQWVLLTLQVHHPVSFYHMRVMSKSHRGAGICLP